MKCYKKKKKIKYTDTYVNYVWSRYKNLIDSLYVRV